MIRSINSQTIEWSKLAKAGNLLSCERSKYLFAHSIRIQRSAVFQSIIKSPSRCVKCCSCKEFFHRKCISTIILEDSSANWRCPNCERALKQEEKNNH